MAPPLLIKILTKLATETFLAKAMVHIGRELAKNTENELDDKLVSSVAEALGVDG